VTYTAPIQIAEMTISTPAAASWKAGGAGTKPVKKVKPISPVVANTTVSPPSSEGNTFSGCLA